MQIAITGATGYIGGCLVRAALQAGYEVLALSRRPPLLKDVKWQHFDLGEAGPLVLPPGIQAVFHLAAETKSTRRASTHEVDGAKRLLRAAEESKAKFIFVSSQVARPDAPTPYGRTKWELEQLVFQYGGIVVRPGLVYGGPEQGLFGTICSLVRRFPILPAFVPAPKVQLIHVDDLAAALLKCLSEPPRTLLTVAAPTPISFTRFLWAVARYRCRKTRVFVPVPRGLVLGVLKVMGRNVRERSGLSRLLSLFSLPLSDTRKDWQRLGLSPRTLAAGLSRSGTCRRILLQEGSTFLSYVLRARAPIRLVFRYVRAVERHRNGQALLLPEWVHRCPPLLSLLEGKGTARFQAELQWRLTAALMIAEASPQGAKRFLSLGQRTSLLRDAFRMSRAIAMEVGRVFFQVLLHPFLLFAIRKELDHWE